MEKWTSGTRQKLKVHNREDCEGEVCAIHNPTDHHMLDWPQHWRYDRGIMERLCPCGVGHPDPDDFRIRNSLDYAIHGCCGCCLQPPPPTTPGPPEPPKPPPPPGRILREGDASSKCPYCGSSRAKAKWYSRKSKYCINPECENYLIRALVRSRTERFKIWVRRLL